MSIDAVAYSEPLGLAKRWLWIGMITAAGLAFSRVLACAMPFAALNMRWGEAAAPMLIVWALNRAVGFLLLHYPHPPAPTIGPSYRSRSHVSLGTHECLGPGRRGLPRRLRPAIVGRMLEVNAATFAGLIILNAIAVRFRLIPSPLTPAFA